jgi:type IV secretory pathway VirJ component
VLAADTSAPSDQLAGVSVFQPSQGSKGLIILLPSPKPNQGFELSPDALTNLGYTVARIETAAERLPVPPTTGPELSDTLNQIGKTLERRDPALGDSAPILLGSGSAARLVYETALASPPGRFHSAISIDFCPSATDGGNGSTGASSPGQAHPAMPASWFVFQRHPDCDAETAAKFVDHTANGRHVDVTGDDKALQIQLEALLRWLDPRISDQLIATSKVSDLPLTELRNGPTADPTLAIMLSGDGGWAAFDRGVSSELVRRGVETIGWNSLNYFWKSKSPEQTADDLSQVIERYGQAWGKTQILLIGYSFGADVLPYVLNRLPPSVRQKIRLTVLIGLSSEAAFEFHLSDWLGAQNGTSALPTIPELARYDDRERLLCIYGSDETDSACPAATKVGVKAARLNGDHHFGDNYRTIVDLILGNLRKPG